MSLDNQIQAEKDEIRKILEQQAKEARRKDRWPKGSKKGFRARRRLKRLAGRMAAAKQRLRALVDRRREEQAPGRKIRDFFERKQGISENPAGSNCGPNGITMWQHFTGYDWACQRGGQGVFWCGCIACYVLIHVGGAKIPSRIRIGYNGYIEDDAAAKRNGLRKIDPAKASPGCLATMRYPHIVTILTAPDGRGYVQTGEGNTSPSQAGSQNNGGCVAIKTHHIDEFDTVAEVAGIHFDKEDKR